MKITFINPEMPEAVWNMKDLVIVLSVLVVSLALFSLSILALFGDSNLTIELTIYMQGALAIIFPIAWLKFKYKLSIEALGCRKGTLSIPAILMVGLVAAVIYFLVTAPIRDYAIHLYDKKPVSIIYYLLLPINITGFVIIVLGPCGEEIFVRGFIYGYLRTKLGIITAVLAQSLFFTFLHPQIYLHGIMIKLFLQIFIAGLILGLLYEKTGSLYPSLICHGTLNYISVISLAYQNLAATQ